MFLCKGIITNHDKLPRDELVCWLAYLECFLWLNSIDLDIVTYTIQIKEQRYKHWFISEHFALIVDWFAHNDLDLNIWFGILPSIVQTFDNSMSSICTRYRLTCTIVDRTLDKSKQNLCIFSSVCTWYRLTCTIVNGALDKLNQNWCISVDKPN